MFRKITSYSNNINKEFITVNKNGYIYVNSPVKRQIYDRFGTPYYTDELIDEDNKILRLQFSENGAFTLNDSHGSGLKIRLGEYEKYDIKPGRYYNITYGKDYIDISYKEEPNNG